MVPDMCSDAGLVGKKTNHSLRVSGATSLFEAGVPERVIQQRTGHRSLLSLQMYERVSGGQEKAVLLHFSIIILIINYLCHHYLILLMVKRTNDFNFSTTELVMCYFFVYIFAIYIFVICVKVIIFGFNYNFCGRIINM